MDLRQSESAGWLPEEQLVEKAKVLNVRCFREYCQHARHAGDPKGVLAEEVNSVEMRKLALTGSESGCVFIRGVLDSTGAAVLRTALEPLARKQGSQDDRLRERRLADGLIELAAHSMSPAQVQVTTSLETLMGLAGSPAAEMEFSLPICGKTVERLTCNCSLTRVLLGADSMVIDVGRAKRVASGSQMRALRVRDKHCRWPGCERPASWTEAHHLIHWAHGGGTELGNLVLLCNRHHWLVHEGGWQLVLTEEGGLRAIPPRHSFRYWARGPDQEAA